MEVLSVEGEHLVRACRFRGGNDGRVMHLLAANAMFRDELLPRGINGWGVGSKLKKTFTPFPQGCGRFFRRHAKAVFGTRASGNRPELPFDLGAKEKVSATPQGDPQRLAGFFMLSVVPSGKTTEDI
ncbi:MAG TPA: hypothetical protein VN829_04625 [Dongiaceae bacterium]|nr:hypothetical protein [Dongiaceae bacterium]